jgi:broad specificity phosphatase PhoE
MTTFFLIRHGSCAALRQTLWGRTPGVCLNEKGKLQVQQLMERLREITFEALYSSPLERAVETAETIARAMNLEVNTNSAFNEIDFGDWTGKSFEGLSSDEHWRHFNAVRSAVRIPGGESFLEVQTRVVNEFEGLSLQHVDARVGIVTHADIIKAAIVYFAAMPIDLLHRIEISPASVNVLALERGNATVLTINNKLDLDDLWTD